MHQANDLLHACYQALLRNMRSVIEQRILDADRNGALLQRFQEHIDQRFQALRQQSDAQLLQPRDLTSLIIQLIGEPDAEPEPQPELEPELTPDIVPAGMVPAMDSIDNVSTCEPELMPHDTSSGGTDDNETIALDSVALPTSETDVEQTNGSDQRQHPSPPSPQASSHTTAQQQQQSKKRRSRKPKAIPLSALESSLDVSMNTTAAATATTSAASTSSALLEKRADWAPRVQSPTSTTATPANKPMSLLQIQQEQARIASSSNRHASSKQPTRTKIATTVTSPQYQQQAKPVVEVIRASGPMTINKPTKRNTTPSAGPSPKAETILSPTRGWKAIHSPPASSSPPTHAPSLREIQQDQARIAKQTTTTRAQQVPATSPKKPLSAPTLQSTSASGMVPMVPPVRPRVSTSATAAAKSPTKLSSKSTPWMSTDLATSFPPISEAIKESKPTTQRRGRTSSSSSSSTGSTTAARRPRTLAEIMSEEQVMQEIREGYAALGVEFDPSAADTMQQIAEILGIDIIDSHLI
jgi:hypothetical protein